MVSSIENAGSAQATAVTPQAAPVRTSVDATKPDEGQRVANAGNVQTQRPSGPQRVVSNTASLNSASVDAAANYASVQGRKDQTNQAAQAVQQLETAKANLDKMRDNLTQIVKMYPPYPKDSSQRAQLLNEVSGLRKLTDQLTVPPAYETMINQAISSKTLGDVGSSDEEVAADLAALDRVSNQVTLEVGKLFSQGDVGGASGVGAAMAAQQQSQRASFGLAAAASGVASDAAQSLASTFS